MVKPDTSIGCSKATNLDTKQHSSHFLAAADGRGLHLSAVSTFPIPIAFHGHGGRKRTRAKLRTEAKPKMVLEMNIPNQIMGISIKENRTGIRLFSWLCSMKVLKACIQDPAPYLA